MLWRKKGSNILFWPLWTFVLLCIYAVYKVRYANPVKLLAINVLML